MLDVVLSPATQTAPEYCFLWIDWWPLCMTKAEWSGWMQAIFSVVAICASAGVVIWQNWKAEQRDRQHRVDRVDGGYMLVGEAVRMLTRMRDHFRADAVIPNRDIDRTTNAVHALREFRVHALEPAHLRVEMMDAIQGVELAYRGVSALYSRWRNQAQIDTHQAFQDIDNGLGAVNAANSVLEWWLEKADSTI